MVKSIIVFSDKTESSLCLAQLKHTTYIPWHTTQAITNGIRGLNRIYASLDESSDFKLFIDNHCIHLLSPMTGNTDIPTSLANSRNIKKLPVVIPMAPTFRRNLFWGLPGYTGVYVFITENNLVPEKIYIFFPVVHLLVLLIEFNLIILVLKMGFLCLENFLLLIIIGYL